jgi:hypothetical protein
MGMMPPKVPRKVLEPESSEAGTSEDSNAEEARIREQFEEYRKAVRIAKDLKQSRDSPVDLKFFAKEAWQEGFGRSVESIYSLYRRALAKKYDDPIAPRGRPTKKPNPLEIHTFAVQAAANAKSGEILLTPSSLATFDKFSSAQKNDPRAHTLHGSKLHEFVDEVCTRLLLLATVFCLLFNR